MLPDDLKNYEPDSFQLMSPDVAGLLIFAAVVVLLLLERAGIL